MKHVDPRLFFPSVIHDVPSKLDFIEWLKTKPQDEEYAFYEIKECAVSQYAIARGKWREYINSGPTVSVWNELIDTASVLPHTYGELLERANK